MKIKLTPLIKIYKSTVNNTLYVMIRYFYNKIDTNNAFYLLVRKISGEGRPSSQNLINYKTK